MTAICRLGTVLRTLEGAHLDHRGGAGDVQKVSDEEIELVEDEGEDPSEGSENFEMGTLEGVASSLGDLSRKGSLEGVLSNRRTVRSSKPIPSVTKG